MEFSERIEVRINKLTLERIQDVVEDALDYENVRKFDSISHFVRCAINKFLNEEEKKIKRVDLDGTGKVE